MIEIDLNQWRLTKLGARTGKVVPDRASVTWNGKLYVQIDTHGAISVLARKLVSDGCPDQPRRTAPTSGRSFHRFASPTLIQNERKGPRLRPPVEWPFPINCTNVH